MASSWSSKFRKTPVKSSTAGPLLVASPHSTPLFFPSFDVSEQPQVHGIPPLATWGSLVVHLPNKASYISCLLLPVGPRVKSHSFMTAQLSPRDSQTCRVLSLLRTLAIQRLADIFGNAPALDICKGHRCLDARTEWSHPSAGSQLGKRRLTCTLVGAALSHAVTTLW